MVITEIKWFEYADNSINTFHLFFFFSFGLTQHTLIISQFLWVTFQAWLSCIACKALIKVLVRAKVSSEAQLGKNLLPSSCDC